MPCDQLTKSINHNKSNDYRLPFPEDERINQRAGGGKEERESERKRSTLEKMNLLNNSVTQRLFQAKKEKKEREKETKREKKQQRYQNWSILHSSSILPTTRTKKK